MLKAIQNWKLSGNGRDNVNTEADMDKIRFCGVGYDDSTDVESDVILVDDDRWSFCQRLGGVNAISLAYFWAKADLINLVTEVRQNCASIGLSSNWCIEGYAKRCEPR